MISIKLYHRFLAWLLRRRLVRQRVQNIISLRAGRREAKLLRREMCRHRRLAAQQSAKVLPLSLSRRRTAGGAGEQLQLVVANMPKLEKRAG